MTQKQYTINNYTMCNNIMVSIYIHLLSYKQLLFRLIFSFFKVSFSHLNFVGWQFLIFFSLFLFSSSLLPWFVIYFTCQAVLKTAFFCIRTPVKVQSQCVIEQYPLLIHYFQTIFVELILLHQQQQHASWALSGPALKNKFTQQ